jgi:hypothetical protein
MIDMISGQNRFPMVDTVYPTSKTPTWKPLFLFVPRSYFKNAGTDSLIRRPVFEIQKPRQTGWNIQLPGSLPQFLEIQPVGEPSR